MLALGSVVLLWSVLADGGLPLLIQESGLILHEEPYQSLSVLSAQTPS